MWGIKGPAADEYLKNRVKYGIRLSLSLAFMQPEAYHLRSLRAKPIFQLMYTFLIVVIAIIGLLLALIILLQSGKGGGLAGIAAGGATQQILGARTAPDILEKGTWVLATIFIVLCILTNFVIGDGDAPDSVIQQGTQEQAVPTLPPVDVAPGNDGAAPDAGSGDGGADAGAGQDG